MLGAIFLARFQQPSYLQVEKRPEYLPLFLSPFFIGLSIALAIAFILYLGALTIGWILAGFTRF
jgi:hypothetical protein